MFLFGTRTSSAVFPGDPASFVAGGFSIAQMRGSESGLAGFGVWMKEVLKAAGWASMIAIGSLVFTWFTKKWESKGYPTLPIQALAPAGGARMGMGMGGGVTIGTLANAKPAVAASGGFDEYKD